jgi:hypothetical protein
MSFLEKVAEAPNQREALLLIAGALDIILDAITTVPVVDDDNGWSSGWDNDGIQSMYREGDDYIIPVAPPDVMGDRRQFIANYNIPEGDAYEKGGPEWLTAYDTEFVMSLPVDARKLMAVDFEKRGLFQAAREFAVAFLKGDASNMATAVPLADTLLK